MSSWIALHDPPIRQIKNGEKCSSLGCDGTLFITKELRAFGANIAICSKCGDARCARCGREAIKYNKGDFVRIVFRRFIAPIEDDAENDGKYFCKPCGIR